jgi:uncharacterized membrane protein
MQVLWQDWLSLLLRWAHIVAAISWIGSSFYFMWLDSSLRRPPGVPPGVKGENWTVHGGGFYQTRKFTVAPEGMPEALHWFRWESYLTWLSGFALMGVVYYWSASTYLVDPAAGLLPWQGVAVSVAALAGAWIGYDLLCRSRLRRAPAVLFAVLFALLVAATWALGLVLAGRAVFLQVGAMIATLMTGNVLLVIIPNQRVVVADLKAGRMPDARYGEIAKLRSTHNNYLTLPVIFLMISNHYPMTFGHAWNWAVVAFALAIGAVVRHWFNAHESGRRGRAVAWQWPVSVALVGGMVAFATWRPDARGAAHDAAGGQPVSAHEAVAIARARCAACHAAAPAHEAFAEAPGGVMLETADQLRAAAPRVLAQAVLTQAMPLGNETGMTDEERARLGAWISGGMPE